MKKMIIALLLFLGVPVMMTSTSSCSSILQGINPNTINTINKISNIAQTAREISGLLGGSLGLNSGQKSSLVDIFTNYIGGTNKISGFANKDPKYYAKELLGLNKGTLGKLSGILSAAQYAKLLGFGKNSNSTGGLMNLIGGGKHVSNNASSVLGGLLLNGFNFLGDKG